MRKSLLLLGLFVAACGQAEDESDPAIGVEMQAIIGGTKASGYASAALLDMHGTNGSYYRCSAAVIAPKVVLTAGHCVDGMDAWDVYVGTSKRSTKRAETYDWKENGATIVNPIHHDIGLVYLDDAIVLPSYPTLASAPVANDTVVTNVGRVLNGVVTNELYGASVKVRDGSSVGYAFDYAAVDVIEHGDSGGPVFAGSQTIVAVNSGAGASTEVLARVDLLRAWIQAKIASASPSPSPSPSPAPPPPPPAPSSNCVAEVEGNDSFAKANALVSAACGTIKSTSDVDWFTTVVPVGTSTIEIAGGDSVFAAGFVAKGACVPSLSGLKKASIRASGAPAVVCVAVSSRSIAAYRLSVTR